MLLLELVWMRLLLPWWILPIERFVVDRCLHSFCFIFMVGLDSMESIRCSCCILVDLESRLSQSLPEATFNYKSSQLTNNLGGRTRRG